jgi:hypothetical protein
MGQLVDWLIIVGYHTGSKQGAVASFCFDGDEWFGFIIT